jgi:hypothetical protein
MALTSTANWLIYVDVMICFVPLALTWLFGLVVVPPRLHADRSAGTSPALATLL